MEAKLGVLVLDTCFPRLLGDPGNPATYRITAVLRRVEKATVDKIVKPVISEDVTILFIDAARELEKERATATTTSCNFLGIYSGQGCQQRKDSSVYINVVPFTTRSGKPHKDL